MEVYVRDDGMLAVRNGPGSAGGPMPIRATGVPDVNNIYGAGGLFGTCMHHPTLVNAMVGPIGFERVLNWYGSAVETDIYEALTYIGTTGTAQASGCADCGKPRERRCAQSSCFGRMCQQTNEMQFDRIGLRYTPNVPTMAMFGNITDAAGNTIIGMGENITDIFTLQVKESAYNLALDVSTTLWDGNPANNLGGREEFSGFYLLVNTGKKDVKTGHACQALDSLIMSYGNHVIGAAGSPSILAYIAAIMRRLWNRARAAGLNDMSMVTYLTMHPNLWDCVADAAACEFGLTCAQQGAATTYNNALEVARMRDRFYSEMYIPIDGRNIPVVLDSQMPVTNTSQGLTNLQCGDIFAITTQINGQLVTFGEYQDMQQTAGNVIAWMRANFGASFVTVTDGGRYAIAPTTSGGYCFDVRTLVKPRIKMIMPWLSGRLDDVCCYNLGGPYPDVTGSGGVYEIDGGVDSWPEEYLYGDCWPTGGGGREAPPQ